MQRACRLPDGRLDDYASHVIAGNYAPRDGPFRPIAAKLAGVNLTFPDRRRRHTAAKLAAAQNHRIRGGNGDSVLDHIRSGERDEGALGIDDFCGHVDF